MPKCNYVLVTTKGHQYTAIGNAMSLLVQQAIGKFINPTRYRQIVETESKEKLNPRQQETITKAQKHSSTTAKRHYQMNASREVASEGAKCMDVLTGSQRGKHTSELANKLTEIEMHETTLDKDDGTVETNDASLAPVPNDVTNLKDQQEEDVIVVNDEQLISEQSPCSSKNDGNQKDSVDEMAALDGINLEDCDKELADITDDKHAKGIIKEVEVKIEELEDPKRLCFTPVEDNFIKQGYAKYKSTASVWASILKDEAFKFHPSRKRDTLRVRATTLGLIKGKRNGRKCKKGSSNNSTTVE